MAAPRKLSEIYGSLTFNKKVMAEKLCKATYEGLLEIMEFGGKMTSEMANEIANAMKEWAIANGATHFTHWFQPQRGVTAEKHDSFLTFSQTGEALERFSGKQLIQSEPDASSFPSGGMRSTFEARGYTAWDPSSPAFLSRADKTSTLVIPSVYLSWTGEVLDLKTPLLRSLHEVENSAFRLLKLFGNRTAKYVKTTSGPEQEYFLIAKKYFEQRPDLIFTGRTLIGASPAKGQQMEDHYFGSIKHKVLCFMEDVDQALFERGIPAKTRHNEVAPNQFELAPLFEEANLAIDHNLQAMEIMRQVAETHGMAILFHEKPFFGINGSGKHLNMSYMDSDGNNLLEPGASPKKNIQFMTFLSAIVLGVNKYGHLLRVAVADAGNDHRLGANEAPPAIMSVYLGEYLTRIFLDLDKELPKAVDSQDSLDLKVKKLPSIRLDNTDRNRTSPVAFTGNKFEFRATGAAQNCAEAATVFNLLAAWGMDEISSRIEKISSSGRDIRDVALEVIKGATKESQRVIFDGNGYAGDWHAEAQRRGLPNAHNTPEALKMLIARDSIELFEKYKVLSTTEMHAKHEIKLDAYYKTKVMELNVLKNLIYTRIIPSIAKQILSYAGAGAAMGSGGGKTLKSLAARLEAALDNIDKNAATIDSLLEKIDNEGSLEKKVDILAEKGVTLLAEIRLHCDQAEGLVEDSLWDLPKYGEMLFLI